MKEELKTFKDFLEDLGAAAKGIAIAVIVLVPTAIGLVYLFAWASRILPAP